MRCLYHCRLSPSHHQDRSGHPQIGDHRLRTLTRVVLIDNAGNQARSDPWTAATTDALPALETSIALSPVAPEGTNSWYVTTPTVSLTASPAVPAYTYYSWNGSALTTYAGPLQPPADGSHTLSYWSVDQAHQRADEATQQATVKVDTLPDVRPGSVNGAGTYFSMSETVTAETSSSPTPVPPTIVAAQAPNGNHVTVAWQQVTSHVGAAGYHVWRSEDGVTYSQIATMNGPTSNHYSDVGLGSSRRYWYAVSEFDDRGESSLSDTSPAVWNAIAPTTGLPDRPNGLVAVEASHTAVITWEPSANPSVVGYFVLRADASLGEVTTLTSTPTTGTGYFDLTPLNDYTYYYSVVAVDASATIGRPSLEVLARPHRSDGLTPHVFDQDSGCACHRSHAGPNQMGLILPGIQKSSLCLGCHSGGTASWNTRVQLEDPLAKSTHPVSLDESATGRLTCDSCHRPVYSKAENPQFLLRVDGSWVCTAVTGTPGPSGDGFCYRCHGANSTLPFGDMSVFEQSDHAKIADPPSGSGIKCEYCHATHASRNERLLKYANFMLCIQCHNASSSFGNPDIWTRMQSSDETQTRHPMLPEDQQNGARLVCENCHNTHDVTAQNPLVDPHNPSPAGRWAGSRGDELTYCFACHDGGALPTALETTRWADPVLASGAATTVPDIEAAYSTNVHGFGVPSDVTTAQAFLRPDMGYTTDTTLQCRACHDPHGTTNSYTLNTAAKSADGNTTVDGLLVFKIPAGSLTPTSPVGYDLRFYCNSCHLFDPATHDPMAGTDTTVFPNDCHRCHQHLDATRTSGTTGL